MGYYLQIDEDDPAPLASLTGWSDVIRWANGLSPQDAPTLHHLCEFGWEEDADALKSQLASATKDSPPPDAPTQDTLKNFSALLDAHSGGITVVSVTDGLGGEKEEDIKMSVDFSLSAGRTVRGDYAIYPNSLLFEAGNYPDKGFAITPAELAAAAAAAARSVPFNIEHDEYGAHAATEGLFGGILRHWIDPSDPSRLRGEVAIPLPLDEKLSKKAPSMEFNKETKSIIGAALTYTPRVTEAALMSAAVHFANTRHNTPEGQTDLQNIHDMTARSGAVCDRGNTAQMSPSSFSSQHEATAMQKIHDVAADHGATCSKGEAPSWVKSAFSRIAHPKEKTMFETIKALFKKAGVSDADIETLTVADFAAPAAGMTDAEKAQFSALVADNARLKAAVVLKDAAAFADKAITDCRAYPAERASLIALFTQAAQDDQSSPATVTFSTDRDGKPLTGSRTDALTHGVASRPPHGLTSEQVQTAAFTGGSILPPRTGKTPEEVQAAVDKAVAAERKALGLPDPAK